MPDRGTFIFEGRMKLTAWFRNANGETKKSPYYWNLSMEHDHRKKFVLSRLSCPTQELLI